MAYLSTKEEFIDEIRALDPALKNIKIKNIEIDKATNSARFLFISDVAVSDSLKKTIAEKVIGFLPEAFSEVSVDVEKIASDPELVNLAVLNYLKQNYKSVSIFLDESDISSAQVGGVVKFTIKLPKDGAEYVEKNGALRKLSEYLANRFCAEFVGTTEIKEDDNIVNIMQEEVYESELEKITHRTIKVSGMQVIDDATLPDTAVYIEDMGSSGSAVICGKIISIEERKTTKGKPYFLIHINDNTAGTGGLYFSKGTTVDKIRQLQEGDGIIARIEIGEYNGRPSIRFEKINRCEFPEDFVPEDKPKKNPPRNFKKIFPTPAETEKQNTVFEMGRALPEELTKNDYVVFDLETSGLDNTDEITEFGAVKIRGGKIVEQWTTLVHINKKLSETNIAITGITDEMLKDAPKIEEVFPDFMKFIDGTIVVGHNVDFDAGFVSREANREDYNFRNKTIDTCSMARTYVLGLKNYKLDTVAEHFNVVFRHHRALSDAYATAEIFIEMMKIKAEKGNKV